MKAELGHSRYVDDLHARDRLEQPTRRACIEVLLGGAGVRVQRDAHRTWQWLEVEPMQVVTYSTSLLPLVVAARPKPPNVVV